MTIYYIRRSAVPVMGDLIGEIMTAPTKQERYKSYAVLQSALSLWNVSPRVMPQMAISLVCVN